MDSGKGSESAPSRRRNLQRLIRAKTIGYEDFLRCGGEAGARDAGKLRSEGKDDVTRDGDIMLFRFNV